MKTKLIVVAIATLMLGLSFAWQAGTASAVPACPFADSENATACVISSPWTPGSGPFTFSKDLDIKAGGSISNLGTAGITININGSSGGTGALIMEPGASVIDASEDGSPANDGAGPITINATGAGSLAADSIIRSQNNSQGGDGGAISLTFGATSSFAGLIDSEATAGTTSNSGGPITIGVTGNLTMTAGSQINSEKNADSGAAGEIKITVSGDMTMQGGTPGAQILSKHPGATNGTPGGNVTIKVGTGDLGTFTMESGSLIDSGGAGAAGNIAVTAGLKIDVQEGASVLAGKISEEDTRGHGGRIFLISGCLTNIFGTVSSQGHDPGADLVHLEGCQVHLGPHAIVESTGAAHDTSVGNSCDGIDDPAVDGFGNPLRGGDAGEVLRGDHPDNSTVCIEIWGRHVILDQGSEVNADFALSGGTQGHGWIDIFAEQDIIINGPASGHFAVHTNSGLGNDIGGDIRVMAKKSFITMTGLALQADDTFNGGAGGTITVDGFGAITLDNAGSPPAGATLEAAGDNSGVGIPCDGGAGACGQGGKISVRSDNSTISWQNGVGNVNPDVGASPPAGSIALTACTAGGINVSGTNFDDATPSSNSGPGFCTSGPPIPECTGVCDATHYVIFNPGGRWDRCGESSISGHKFDTDHTPLSGWVIHLYLAGILIDTKVTLADGSYTFIVTGGQSYVVCEVQKPPAAEASPTGPASATIAACTGAGEAPWGYNVTVNVHGSCCEGQKVTGKDFVNNLVGGTKNCPEDLDRSKLLTRVVDTGSLLGGGTGAPGNPINYWTLQDAYNAAKASPATIDEVIGMYSKTTENVVLDTYSAKSITITQCTSAQITAKNSGYPAWDIKSTKKLLIIGPDSVGGTIGWYIETGSHELKSIRSNGASVAGVRINSNSNKVSFNNVSSSGIGVDILGNSNTIQSGTIGPNTGAGVHIGAGKTGNQVSGATIQNNGNNGVFVEGNSNTIQSNKLNTNAPNGIKVTGNTNTIQSDQSDSNSQDGYNIAGTGNTVKDNKASSNSQDGFDLSGSGQKLTGSGSNQTTNDYRISSISAVSGPSGNKADGTSIPAAGKCNGFFTNPAVTTCN